MKIGFDAKRAVQNHTGLGNYSRFILEVLTKNYPENEYLLYAPKRKENKELEPIVERAQTTLIFPSSVLGRVLPSYWRVWSIIEQLKKDRNDLFIGLSNELPLSINRSGKKSIVVIHDLIFLRYPTYYAFIDRKIYAYKFRKACENADHIIAVSEQTKRDIIQFFGISPEKITVVYQGCAAVFGQPVTEERKEEVRRTYHLPERFLLNVGSIEDRKNLLLIVKALEHLPKEVKLVAIGKSTPYCERVRRYVEEHGLGERVLILNKVAYKDLPVVYQMADIFIYPSRFEGFGIPILEAIRSRVPVIGATGSCLEEAGGPDALYVNPDDDRQLADYIQRILGDATFAHQMVERSLVYAERFSEESIAREVIKVIQRTL